MAQSITYSTAFHDAPPSVLSALKKDSKLAELWNNLTDIQRNEWACYATTGAKPETREKHVERMVSDMKAGKKTPCCWPGCPHRRPKAAKWFGTKKG
jgi:uncharacterized protein YdeI (YjbR/CyaY-like superfamily)